MGKSSDAYFGIRLSKSSCLIRGTDGSTSRASESKSISSRSTYNGQTQFERHKSYMKNYLLYYSNVDSIEKFPIKDAPPQVTEISILKSAHRFLWNQEEDESTLSWEARLAKNYYNRLYKEYYLSDLSRYRKNIIALRARTKDEVIDGKGQFSCGNLSCSRDTDLRSWEVNFKYVEQGETKNALVKLRLCPRCSYKLHYKKIRELRHKARKQEAHSKSE